MLGERLPYVLLPGAATQDEAAEDPLTAAKAGSPANYELYWRNKLHRPLSELFATCLSPTALQHLLNGPHTLVKVDLHSSARGAVPGSKKQSKGRQTGLNQFFKGASLSLHNVCPGTFTQCHCSTFFMHQSLRLKCVGRSMKVWQRCTCLPVIT